MTAETQLILKKLDRIQEQFDQLMESKQSDTTEWLNEKDAARLLNISPTTLRAYRRDGKVTQFRARVSGHGVQYKRSALLELFISTEPQK